MANQGDTSKPVARTRELHGRRVILSPAREITPDNVVNELLQSIVVHNLNSSEIDYLWRYNAGVQPVLHRIKEHRPEICNKVVENHANEITSFWKGYVWGEPIQYVSRNGDDTTPAIEELNSYMMAEDKEAKDTEIGEWMMVCGTAFRMVLPDQAVGDTDTESPFNIYTLDPRQTFVVYSSEFDRRPLMAVHYIVNRDTIPTYFIYTKDSYYVVEGDLLQSVTPHRLGMIPIFEYPANSSRLGAFEIVIPLLDAINNLDSNSLDAVEQTVQAFIKFINCDIDEEQFKALKDLGAIKVKSLDGQNADVDMVTNDISQDQTHILRKDLYDAVLTICGIPNRNGGTSTSDTGQAVIYRDGWSAAESRAKDIEKMFKRSEKNMLKIILGICREANLLNLNLKDIDMKFTRRNYEAIQSKSQVLIQMLAQPKVHPLLAFTSCGMFSDPEGAYAMSQEYYEEEQRKLQIEEVDEAGHNHDDSDEDVNEDV